MKIPLLITILITIFLALTPLGTPLQSDQAIRTLRAASNQAIATSNITAFSESLDSDFIVVTGNGTILTRQAYIAAFATDFKDPNSVRFQRIPDSIDLSTSAPLAAEHGHWLGRTLNGPILYTGTYLAMWRDTPTGWRLRSELFVSLTCATPAACDAYRKRYQESHK